MPEYTARREFQEAFMHIPGCLRGKSLVEAARFVRGSALLEWERFPSHQQIAPVGSVQNPSCLFPHIVRRQPQIVSGRKPYVPYTYDAEQGQRNLAESRLEAVPIPSPFFLPSDPYQWRMTASVFVSHRWQDPVHPDLQGIQLRALQSLIRSMYDIVAAAHLPGPERVAKLPSLRRHGVLQAAALLNPDDWWKDHAARSLLDSVLGRVGFWLDYASLPQAPRSPEEDVAFRHGLRSLPEFSEACTAFLVLRDAGDDYMGRGWCAHETWNALRQSALNTALVVLRVDLVGQPIELHDLLPGTDEWHSNQQLFERVYGLHRACLLWEDPNTQLSFKQSARLLLDIATGMSVLERQLASSPTSDNGLEVREKALRYLQSKGGAPCLHPAPFWGERNLGWVHNRIARELDRSPDHRVDVTTILHKTLEDLHLKCTNGSDGALVACCMLMNNHGRYAGMQVFWSMCRDRLFAKRHLRLRKFQRENSDLPCYEFEFDDD